MHSNSPRGGQAVVYETQPLTPNGVITPHPIAPRVTLPCAPQKSSGFADFTLAPSYPNGYLPTPAGGSVICSGYCS